MRWESSGDRVSLVFSIILGTSVILIPASLVIIILKKSWLESEFVKERCSESFEGMKKTKTSLLLVPFFILRRIYTIFTVIFYQESPVFQLQSYILISQFYLMYLVHVKPYESRLTNRLEIFNEGCILVVAYINLLLSDFVTDIDVHWNAGFALIGISLINFFVNLLVISVSSCISLSLRIRKCRRERANKRREQYKV